MKTQRSATTVAAHIAGEIQRCGPISFARFMELALYTPDLGYYERQREIGRRGDFYTSVSVGPLFGELLAFQFAQWFDQEDRSDRLQIVEAGAHDGALAADILAWMQRWRPDLLARLEYCLIEPSSAHRTWQQGKLRDWLPKLKWISDITELEPGDATRIIFCNEFLDAMPIHRLAWDNVQKKWDECFVTCKQGAFQWHVGDATPGLAEFLPAVTSDLAAVLPAGFILELSPAAVAWWEKAANALGRGILFTIDYGLTSAEQLLPQHAHGTLRTFFSHRVGGDPLESPGQCDITAHVSFSAIEAAGVSAGLTTGGLTEQAKFLTRILAQIEEKPGKFDAWTPARTRQFQTLTHPDHLGRAFRVLIQARHPVRPH